MKDTCKEAILWLGECTRAELICTEGDQPHREQRFFNNEQVGDHWENLEEISMLAQHSTEIAFGLD